MGVVRRSIFFLTFRSNSTLLSYAGNENNQQTESKSLNTHGVSERHHGANRLPGVHQVEGVVDLFQRHGMRDEVVDVDLSVHVPVDDLRHVGTSLGAAEGRTLPDATGDQLERPGGDLRAGRRHADDEIGRAHV